MPRALPFTARSCDWQGRWPVENNIRKTDHDGPGDDRALALANLIDDDQPIDWESEAGVATSDERTRRARRAARPRSIDAGLSRSRRRRRDRGDGARGSRAGASELGVADDPRTDWPRRLRQGLSRPRCPRQKRRAEALPDHAGERRRTVQPRTARGIAPRQDRTRQRRRRSTASSDRMAATACGCSSSTAARWSRNCRHAVL